MLRVGIIGFGFIAENGHVPYYLTNGLVDIRAVADICPERLAVAQQIFPRASLFDSAESLFYHCGSNLDVVDICTPPYAHSSVIEQALRLKLHVLCEKPLTLNVQDVFRLISLAEESDRVVYPCHNYLFSPAVENIRTLMKTRTIGEPMKAFLYTYRPHHARGVKEWAPDWRRDETIALGGILADHGPHSIYLASDIFNRADVAHVACMLGYMGQDGQGTEDSVQLELRFSSGQVASVFMTWAAPFRQSRYIIVGTKGWIELLDDDLLVSTSQGLQHYETVSRSSDPSHRDWFQMMFADFVDCIGQGLPSLRKHAAQAWLVAGTIAGAYTSAANNRQWVAVPPCPW